MASEERVGLITGGASGIGLAVTEKLIADGWSITVVDFNQEAGEALERRRRSRVKFVYANVAVYKELSNAFVESWEKWGRLDFVYANAGIGDRMGWYMPAKELPDGSPVEPDVATMDICIKAVAWTAYIGMHYFRKNRDRVGKLVFTASQAGLYPAGSIPLYCAAKHGVVGLAGALAQHYTASGERITVNCVCPGLVRTPITPGAVLDATPHMLQTPIATVVRAVEGFVNDDSLQGQIAECSVEEIRFVPQREYPDEATRFNFSDGISQSINRATFMKQLKERNEHLVTLMGPPGGRGG